MARPVDNDICPVCYDEISDIKVVLSCRHSLCTTCFCSMLQNGLYTCAICRTAFPPTRSTRETMMDSWNLVGQRLAQLLMDIGTVTVATIRTRPKTCIAVSVASFTCVSYSLHLSTVMAIGSVNFTFGLLGTVVSSLSTVITRTLFALV